MFGKKGERLMSEDGKQRQIFFKVNMLRKWGKTDKKENYFLGKLPEPV